VQVIEKAITDCYHETLKERLRMANENKWDSASFDKKMKNSKNELTELQNELQDLMIKFCLRALRVYQATRPEPLRPNEVSLLVRNELNSAVADLTAQPNLDTIMKVAKEAWLKESKQ
jgi:muramidase (phage lysozyme)